MSQFWHSHWTEDAYKPGLLGNWQVPKWYPKWPCVRHCVTTSFLADRSGRLLPDKPKSKRSPWGDFKGTWELPLKIDRKLAQKLSAPPRYKIAAWEAHKLHYEGPCGFTAPTAETKKRPESPKRRRSPVKIVERTKKSVTRSKKITDRNKKMIDKSKGKKAEDTLNKTKGKSSTKRAMKTDRAPEGNQLKKVTNDRSEAPEDEDEKTVAVQPEYEEKNTVIKEPEYKEKNTVIKEPEYEEKNTVIEEPENEEKNTVIEEPESKDDKTVSEKPIAEKTHHKHRGKVERTECFCVNELESHSTKEIAPKPTSNVCTVHQRLTV